MADPESIPSIWDGRCPRHGDEMRPVYAGRSRIDRTPLDGPIYRCPVCTGLWRARISKALRCHRRNWGVWWGAELRP